MLAGRVHDTGERMDKPDTQCSAYINVIHMYYIICKWNYRALREQQPYLKVLTVDVHCSVLRVPPHLQHLIGAWYVCYNTEKRPANKPSYTQLLPRTLHPT